MSNEIDALHRRTGNPNPPTPAFYNDYQWIANYLAIHKLSPTSYRYAYLLWIALAAIFLILSLLHFSGARASYLGALFTKHTLRRRTWRKRHTLRINLRAKERGHPTVRQPAVWPSIAQIITVGLMAVGSILLCVLGPDYIAPSTGLWDYSTNMTRRALGDDFVLDRRAIIITTSGPKYTIPKAWWTAGGRTGVIAFALFPLCVLLALKAPPFALLALLTRLYSDKLAWLHRWSGRLIYLVTVAHVVTWSIQLVNDQRPNAGMALNYALLYDQFIYALIAFFSFTFLMVLSIAPIRDQYYEYFYALHIFLVPMTLVFSALHFPPIWWFCWSALIIWAAERLWRLVRGLIVNGYTPGQLIIPPTPIRRPANDPYAPDLKLRSPSPYIYGGSPTTPAIPTPTSATPLNKPFSPIGPNRSSQPLASSPEDSVSSTVYPSRSASPSLTHVAPTPSPRSATFPQSTHAQTYRRPPPPPGYARAELLPGRTVRLTVRTTNKMIRWAPGQHALLCVPGISPLTSHPFTIGSVCAEDGLDAHDSELQGREREMVFFIRTKMGFTLDLWNEVVRLSAQIPASGSVDRRSSFYAAMQQPQAGPLYEAPLLRCLVDGPFGSSARARWMEHETAVIVVGGSGISFGLSILEYLCAQMNRAAGTRHGSGVKMTRVRFVWIIREYSHLLWCVSALRRCIESCPPNSLELDIFVTNVSPGKTTPPKHNWSLAQAAASANMETVDSLIPPQPRFASGAESPSPNGRRRRRDRSQSPANSEDSDSGLSATESVDSLADVSYTPAAQKRQQRKSVQPSKSTSYPPSRSDQDDDSNTLYSDEEGDHVAELTNWDGEDDARVPGEARFSRVLQKQARMSRANFRRMSSVAFEKHRPGHRPLSGMSESVTFDVLGRYSANANDWDGGEKGLPPARRRPPPPRGFNRESLRPLSSADLLRASEGPAGPLSTLRHSHLPSPLHAQDVVVPSRHVASSSRESNNTLHVPSPTPSPSKPTFGLGPGDVSKHSRNRMSLHISTTNHEHTLLPPLSPGPDGRNSPTPSALDSTYSLHDTHSIGGNTDRTSLRNLVSPGPGPSGSDAVDLRLFDNLTDAEIDDLRFIVPLAHGGRPKLDRIMNDEVERSKGAVIVGCCGPTSLNAVLRKVVAAKIDPGRVRRGDRRGMISFVSEDFAW